MHKIMKKHIFGLAIFSFIVLAAAFIYGILVYSDASSVDIAPLIPAKPTNCKFRREINQSEVDSTIVRQAVFSVKTKTLNWEFPASETNKYPTLYLFLKDDKGVRRLDYLRSENCLREKGPASFTKKYSSLSRLSSKTNLYLIPDATGYSYESDRAEEFDAGKAIPVTIDYGK